MSEVPKPRQLNIVTFDGIKFSIKYDTDAITINTLKEFVFRLYCIPIESQQYFFGGRELNDYESLAECGVTWSDHLTLNSKTSIILTANAQESHLLGTSALPSSLDSTTNSALPFRSSVHTPSKSWNFHSGDDRTSFLSVAGNSERPPDAGELQRMMAEFVLDDIFDESGPDNVSYIASPSSSVPSVIPPGFLPSLPMDIASSPPTHWNTEHSSPSTPRSVDQSIVLEMPAGMTSPYVTCSDPSSENEATVHFRTRMCLNGPDCRFGEKCWFAHSRTQMESALRSRAQYLRIMAEKDKIKAAIISGSPIISTSLKQLLDTSKLMTVITVDSKIFRVPAVIPNDGEGIPIPLLPESAPRNASNGNQGGNGSNRDLHSLSQKERKENDREYRTSEANTSSKTYRDDPSRRGTKMCNRLLKNGHCPYGSGCWFAHPPSNADDSKMGIISPDVMPPDSDLEFSPHPSHPTSVERRPSPDLVRGH